MDIEEKARAEGWVPEDEWRGPKEQWTDAETFVKRGQELAPILAAKNKKLEQQLQDQEQKIAKLMSASEEFREIANKSIEKSKQERDAAIAKLQEQRKAGINEGDGQKVLEAEAQIEKLKTEGEKKPTVEATQEKWNQQAVKWAQDNPWYGIRSSEFDQEKRIYADGLSDLIMSELPHLKNDPEGYFKELSSRVEKRFTKTNENREKSTVEANGGKKSRGGNGKSFENLPEDAKAGFERMKFLMPSLTEDEYVKNYTWE